MPKPKPTEIIRHELVLGRKEFELIENSLVYPALVGSLRDLLPFVKDAGTAIALIEGIATALEMMGINTPIPTVIDLQEWFAANGYTWDEVLKKWKRVDEIIEDPVGELVVDPITGEIDYQVFTAQQLIRLFFSQGSDAFGSFRGQWGMGR